MELKINSIFYTLQGEGYHAGTPSIFIRLSDCNLRCSFCDTEFLSGKMMTVDKIISECKKYKGKHIVLTGGEPSFQDINQLVNQLRKQCYYVQIETNGMFPLTWTIDWITFAPKTKPNSINIDYYDEIKIVVNKKTKQLPKLGIEKDQYSFPRHRELCWVSPENPLDHDKKIGTETSSSLSNETLDYCIELVKDNPGWRLSTQQHKYWGIE